MINVQITLSVCVSFLDILSSSVGDLLASAQVSNILLYNYIILLLLLYDLV